MKCERKYCRAVRVIKCQMCTPPRSQILWATPNFCFKFTLLRCFLNDVPVLKKTGSTPSGVHDALLMRATMGWVVCNV